MLDWLVPQRAPLSPLLLTAACVLAAVPAAWIALAADALVTASIGALLHGSWAGIWLSPEFLPVTASPYAEGDAPALAAVALLAGPVGAALLGLAAHTLLQVVRAGAWSRVLALEWAGFATLRVPALVAAAVAPHGRGPVNDLYVHLGEPQSGRWAVAGLAVLALLGAAALVAALSVAAGRAWMRVDGVGFRRHLVRVVAGWPTLVALAGWSALTPWAAAPWLVGWLAATFLALQLLTPRRRTL